MRPPAKSDGFTLIEMMVALVILSLISIAIYRGMDSMLKTRAQIESETRRWQHLSLFFAQLEQDIAQAIVRPVRQRDGSLAPPWQGHAVIQGDEDAELIITRNGINEPGSDQLAPQRIGYRLDNGEIILLHWKALDLSPQSEIVRYPILEGVSKFELRYMDQSRTWLAQWPTSVASPPLPTAVEVSITLSDNSKFTRIFAL